MAAAALVFSVCVCVFACVLRCVCAPVSWPCRADRPSSHGAGSSCVLCCRSGCLSHWSVVSTVSRHSGSTKAVSLSPLRPSLISFFRFPATQSSSPSPSFVTPHFPFRLLNRLFFFYSSVSRSVPPPSPWPRRPFLSVCTHHLPNSPG